MVSYSRTASLIRLILKNNSILIQKCDTSNKFIGVRLLSDTKNCSKQKLEPSVNVNSKDAVQKPENNVEEYSFDKIKLYFNNYVDKYQTKYNEIFGLNLIKQYYSNLQEIEKSILCSYERRRVMQNQLNDLQQKLKDIRYEMDKLPRNSDNYVLLFTKEHALLKDEFKLMEQLKKEEENERQLLALFSENIRKSYQIEMERQVKQKSISYILSCLLAVFSFLLGKSSFFKNQDKNDSGTTAIEKLINNEIQNIKSNLNESFSEIEKQLNHAQLDKDEAKQQIQSILNNSLNDIKKHLIAKSYSDNENHSSSDQSLQVNYQAMIAGSLLTIALSLILKQIF